MLGLGIVQGLYWVLLFFLIVSMLLRSNSIFHPYVAFATMLLYYFSDFLVRGWDDENFEGIPGSSLIIYSLSILIMLTIAAFFAYFVRDQRTEGALGELIKSMRISKRIRAMLFLLGVIILFLEIYKRGSTVNWELQNIVLQTLAKRGQRDWDILAYDGNFVFSLISIMLPLGATVMAFFVITGSNSTRVFALPFYMVFIFLMITDGSRTPMVISLVTLWVFWFVYKPNFVARLICTLTLLALVALSTSIMYQYRGSGFLDNNEEKIINIVYHQDDNFYRSIGTMHYSGETNEKHWNAIEFYYSIIVNPIPRSFWTDKPALDEKFYGNFKLWWTTIFFIGEFAAMFGPIGALILSPLYLLSLYFVLYKSARLLNKPFGLGAYIMVCLYVYMSMRSMLNLTHFIYMPAVSVVVVFTMSRLQGSRSYSGKIY